jgi:Tfp pilus assembly protein PilX
MMKTHPIQKQYGVALITSLIFMVLLTVLVTTALRGSLFEELMARGTGARLNAFQAAEAVLRQAEVDVFVNAVAPLEPFNRTAFKDVTDTPADGLYKQADSIWNTVDLSSTDDDDTKASTLTLSGAESLRYVVECMGNCIAHNPSDAACYPVAFRLTARAAGSDSSAAHMQANYLFIPSDCPNVI